MLTFIRHWFGAPVQLCSATGEEHDWVYDGAFWHHCSGCRKVS